MRSAAVITATIVLLAAGCAEDIKDPIGAEIDFTSPKSVLGHVFWAAQTNRPERLGVLCDRTANKAARRICAVTPLSPDYPSFRKNFARAKLNGEPRITGETAVIKFLYGPGGADRETMTLVRRDGRWLLQSF